MTQRPSALRALAGLDGSLGLRGRDPFAAFKRPRRRRRDRFGQDPETWEESIRRRVDESARITVAVLTAPSAAITAAQAAASERLRAARDENLAILGDQWRNLTGLIHETAHEGFVESARNIAVMRDALAAAIVELANASGEGLRAFLGFSPREAAEVGVLVFLVLAAGGLALLLSPGVQLAIGATGAIPKGVGAGLAGYGRGVGAGVANLGAGLGKALPNIIRLG